MKNCLIFLIVVFSNVGIGVSQERASAPEARVVTVGTVGEIDSKAKSVTLILAASVTVEPPAQGRGANGSRGERSGDNSGHTTGGRIAAPTLKKYKVMISSTTVLKEGDKPIRLEDLKVGDALEVLSANSNSRLDAIEVTRIPRDAPNSR